jgi:hypothetical protein
MKADNKKFESYGEVRSSLLPALVDECCASCSTLSLCWCKEPLAPPLPVHINNPLEGACLIACVGLTARALLLVTEVWQE